MGCGKIVRCRFTRGLLIEENGQREDREANGQDGKRAAVDVDKINSAREVLRFLDKVVKTSALFSQDHSNPKRAQDEFILKLNNFLQTYGELAIEIDGTEVFCDEVPIMEGDGQKDDYLFRLFQDGVSQVKLTAGIAEEEINSLVAILLANFSIGAYAHDDSVTLLWEANLNNARFVISHDFDETMGDPENAPAGTEEYRRLRIALGEKRFEQNGLEGTGASDKESIRIANIEAALAKGGGLHFSPEEKEDLLSQAEADENSIIEKYVEILYREVAAEPEEEHLKRIIAIIGQLFIGMVEGAGLTQAIRLVKLVRGFASKEEKGSDNMKTVQLVLNEICSEKLVTKLLESLSSDSKIEAIDQDRVDEALCFFALLGHNVLEHILCFLTNIGDETTKKKLCGFLSSRGKHRVDLFKKSFDTASSKTIQDLLYILKEIGSPEAGLAMLRVATHDDWHIRVKVIEYSSDVLPPEKLKSLLLKHLEDEDERVRIATIKRLSKVAGDDVVRRIKELIVDSEFRFRNKLEKRMIFSVLGDLGGHSEILFFRECFGQSNPLRRTNIDEIRGLGAYMLGMLGDTESRPDLEKGAKSRLSSTFFKSACSQALNVLDGKSGKGST